MLLTSNCKIVTVWFMVSERGCSTLRRDSPAQDPLYAVPPLSWEEDIPVFIPRDAYVENYDRISRDHLARLEKDGVNPFIDPIHWAQSEHATREALRRHVRPGQRILDVGVGLGGVLESFPELVRYGMDVSLPYLRKTRDKGIRVCCARAEAPPYHPESFDAVLCTDVLEHVFDLYCCCVKMLQTARRGGVLVIRVPYRENLAHYLAPEYAYQYAHLRAFDEYELRLLFEKTLQCEMLEMEPVTYMPNVGRLKQPLPPREQSLLIRQTTRMLQSADPLRYKDFLSDLFLPVEIQCVVRRPA